MFDKAVSSFALSVQSDAHVLPAILEGDIVEKETQGNGLPIGLYGGAVQFLEGLQILAHRHRQPIQASPWNPRAEFKPGEAFKGVLACGALQGYVVLLSRLALRLNADLKSSWE